ncbi:hypothetical protein OUZ56_020153 [Daphnia magna]|uniref:Uncharacterized protein n=1 Tax=Daphnia magna TaxID=35525 RepID=A0ABQ9ZEF4_9CRUS|nr:hypothetical protein OUZ56_020153 [Daphnia magna]
MNRVIFGITAAGVSALTVYHWYSARKREVISSTDVDNLNGRSSVYPHVLSETGIRESAAKETLKRRTNSRHHSTLSKAGLSQL